MSSTKYQLIPLQADKAEVQGPQIPDTVYWT